MDRKAIATRRAAGVSCLVLLAPLIASGAPFALVTLATFLGDPVGFVYQQHEPIRGRSGRATPPEVSMRFPTPQTAGAVILLVFWAPWMAWPVLANVASDPQRWSRPDVYLLLCTTIYAAVSFTLYALSSAVRHNIDPLSPWLTVALHPIAALCLCLGWVRYHDPLLIGTVIAILGWLAWRRTKRKTVAPLQS